jgi:hypothetical protein
MVQTQWYFTFKVLSSKIHVRHPFHVAQTMHTANEGPVRIQYKCLVPIYVFTEMKLLFPKQNFNVLSPSSDTLIYL